MPRLTSTIYMCIGYEYALAHFNYVPLPRHFVVKMYIVEVSRRILLKIKVWVLCCELKKILCHCNDVSAIGYWNWFVFCNERILYSC